MTCVLWSYYSQQVIQTNFIISLGIKLDPLRIFRITRKRFNKSKCANSIIIQCDIYIYIYIYIIYSNITSNSRYFNTTEFRKDIYLSMWFQFKWCIKQHIILNSNSLKNWFVRINRFCVSYIFSIYFIHRKKIKYYLKIIMD